MCVLYSDENHHIFNNHKDRATLINGGFIGDVLEY